MSNAAYFRKRRADLLAKGLCLECKKPRGKGVRCEACAARHSKRVNGTYVKPVIVPAPKTSDRVARMLKLAAFLIPPKSVGWEDLKRKERA